MSKSEIAQAVLGFFVSAIVLACLIGGGHHFLMSVGVVK